MNENGPDRYCPTCGWFPEDADDEENAPIGKCCPSCSSGTIKPITPATPGHSEG